MSISRDERTDRTDRNRRSRTAAKHVPHRTENRLYAAKDGVRQACETLTIAMRSQTVPGKEDILAALRSVENKARDIHAGTPGATRELRDLARDVTRLEYAQEWLNAGGRVLRRLGAKGPEAAHAVTQASDTVLDKIREGNWDGQLAAAVDTLRKAVERGESQVASDQPDPDQ